MTSILLILPAAAFMAVLLLLPLAIGGAQRSGFTDKPGGRKKHDDAVPPVGGLVVFPAFMMALALGGMTAPPWLWYGGALALLLAVGGRDDYAPIRPAIKFAAQFIAAFMIVVPGGAQISGMGDIMGLGMLWMGWMTIPFSVVAVVLLINAVNLMDGLDGLAGGFGLVAAAWLAVCAHQAGQVDLAAAAVLLIAVLAGFLFYNMRSPLRPRALVFMGDSGSLALGLTLAWLSIRMSAPDGVSGVMPMTVAWILSLPIFDICGQFARRVSQGRHPFDADHNHFHHHFIYTGFPVGRATMLILLIALLSGGYGVLGMVAGWPQYALSWAWVASLGAHIYMSLRPHRFRRVLLRLRGGGVS